MASLNKNEAWDLVELSAGRKGKGSDEGGDVYLASS